MVGLKQRRGAEAFNCLIQLVQTEGDVAKQVEIGSLEFEDEVNPRQAEIIDGGDHPQDIGEAGMRLHEVHQGFQGWMVGFFFVHPSPEIPPVHPNYQPHSLAQAPDDIVCSQAVPQAADEEGDQHVAEEMMAIPAEGVIHVISQPEGE